MFAPGYFFLQGQVQLLVGELMQRRNFLEHRRQPLDALLLYTVKILITPDLAGREIFQPLRLFFVGQSFVTGEHGVVAINLR